MKLFDIKYYICLICYIFIAGCTGSGDTINDELTLQSSRVVDLNEIKCRGSLKVITIQGSFSYYVDEDENEYGYDYNLAKNLADYLDVELQLILASNEDDMISKLLSGEGDLIAYRMQMSSDNKSKMKFIDARVDSTKIVLVQQRKKDRITNITDLIGKEVYVAGDNKYLMRINNLNSEIGGGINICNLGDSLKIENIIYNVSIGNYANVVVDDDVVRILSDKLKNLDTSLALGFTQSKSWAVRYDSPLLLEAIENWSIEIKNSRFIELLDKRYITHNSFLEKNNLVIPSGYISPYDDIFKALSKELGWDWRLLAALVWTESHFNPNAISSQGAVGLMQMMPRTAAKFGLENDDYLNPEKSISAGIQYLKYLDMIFKHIEDKEERIKFILASYNAGPGHILDAISLAKKYGRSANIWSDVAEFLLKKSEKKYYLDEVCAHGYFRAKHTVKYIDKVYDKYQEYCNK